MSVRARIALALALAACAAGCGWHAGLRTPNAGQSVGIEIFDSRREVLERGLEPLFADELSRAVVDLVGAPLESSARADVVVRGRILEYRRRSGIRNPDNQLLETGLYFSVSGELVERATGKVLVAAQQPHVWTGYTLDQSVENESDARTRALRYVAESLVLELFRTPVAPAPDATTAAPRS